jgi:pimeloyl-ACP methyl ester carboxylesterase
VLGWRKGGILFTILLITAALAGGLFTYSEHAAYQARKEFPPIGEFVEVEKVRLHYLDSAPDTPTQSIVLLHGASSNLRDFLGNLYPILSRQYRVIAVDRPGHGYSTRPSNGAKEGEWMNPARQAEVIHGLLTRIGARNPVIVGHSWAGAVALAYALDYPAETGGAVILAGATHPWRSQPAIHNRLPAVPLLGDLFVHTLVAPGFALMAEQSVARNFAPNTPPPNYLQSSGAALLIRPDNWRANAEDMRNLAAFLASQKKRYHEIRMPLVIIAGENDQSVSPDIHARRLHAQAPGSQLIMLPDTGHAPHYAHPEAVSDAIEAVARQLRAAGLHASHPDGH